MKGRADIREDIFWAFSRNKLPLLRLANTRTTLEDIFLELTSESKEHMTDEGKEALKDESNL